MLVWVIIIPFFQSEYVAFILPAVFLTTYSVIGLDAVACEITDPYGDDLNDLPVAAFMQVRPLFIFLFEHFVGHISLD